MTKVRIFAKKSEKKQILSEIQGLSVLDFADFDPEYEGFSQDKNAEELEKNRQNALLADKALEVINRLFPEKKPLLSAFSGRREISAETFLSTADTADETLGICRKITDFERKITEAKAEKIRINTAIEQLSPWENADIPLSIRSTDKTAVFIGSLAGTYTLETLLTRLAETAGGLDIYAEVVGYATGRTLIFAATLKTDKDRAMEALRLLDFAYPAQSADLIPVEKIRELKAEITLLDGEIDASVKGIEDLAGYRREIEVLSDWFISAAELNRMKQEVADTRHTLMITGYLPSSDLELLKERLESRFTVYIESEKADPDEAPVKLKNNSFSEPAESITSMYSLPSAADVDPTPITSFFYYLFFGIMLSDAGYGMLMWIATWAVNKFLKPEENMRKNMKLFMFCGISTTFWGIFFGSFFGVDIITTIWTAITGGPLPFKYPFINALEGDAMTMLVLSIGLGLIQVIAGLCVKFRITAKAEGVLDAILDTGMWITTLLGFAVMAVGLVALPILQTVGLSIAAASLIVIAVTGGRKKKGAMKVLGGIASLYDITGYVSDLLSFSRLMALGLTTSAMSMVFNKLGLMVSGGVLGKVFMVVILLVCHSVNFGINALGAYVHTLRLQYVELFSKFYDGGGRPFKPFAFKGKYVRIKEEK